MRQTYNGETVGLSYERSPGSIKKWTSYLDTLSVKYVVSDLRPEDAVEKANQIFRFSSDYCFFRKSCLGQYIDAIEQGCTVLLIPVKEKDGHLCCNSTKFMAQELAEYYKGRIRVLNCPISTNTSKMIDVVGNLTDFFTSQEQLRERALSIWRNSKGHPRINAFSDSPNKRNLNILIIGKINHLFDYTDINSPMIKFLTDKLSVRILDPENNGRKSIRVYKDVLTMLNNSGLVFNEYRESYWPKDLILATLISFKESIDGAILLRDSYCNAGIEELNLLSKMIKAFGIPNLVLSYNLEAQSTMETCIETFVDMLELKKREH